VGRPVGDLRGRQLVACIQNHDQIGNRARGERLGHLTSFAAQQVAAALLLTAPFVPLLFQGEEWAASSPFPYFADHRDPDLADAVRRGRAAEFAAFGWSPDQVLDPESPATFELAKLRWDERLDGEHGEMWRWYRDLIALRRSTPDLLDDRLGVTEVRTDPERRTVTVRRGAVSVLANLGTQDVELPGSADDVVLASVPVTAGSGRDLVALPPCSVAVVRRS
jgi:maltooligosyltrehalose trehalohydrolase